MKEKILKLRKEGKTYNEIKEILNCSKGTISYHCGKGQKEKTKNRTNKRREKVLVKKIDNFKYSRKNNVEKTRKFQKREINFKGDSINKNIEKTFNWNDIVDKYGYNTFCYLSGVKLNLNEKNYQLDHKIPVTRGGDNSFNNLGITHEIVNKMKHNLTPDEFLEWCKKILIFNGYKVTK